MRAFHLNIVEPSAHDALQQLVCCGIRWSAYEDARLWGHIWQAAHQKSAQKLYIDSSRCRACDEASNNSMIHGGTESLGCVNTLLSSMDLQKAC